MGQGLIAGVLVDVALNREFDYAVPAHLGDTVQPGCRVRVPFGRRRVEGYVVSRRDASDFKGLKEIESLVDDRPLMSTPLLALARWMGSYYCGTFEEAIRVLLPAAVRGANLSHKKRLHVRMSGSPVPDALPQRQQEIVDALGPDGMWLSELLKKVGCSASPVQTLARKGVVTMEEQQDARNPLARRQVLPSSPLELTDEQAASVAVIRDSVDMAAPRGEVAHTVLLHGVTGSGKTEVYMQAIDHVLKQGRGAIVLVPEISLTPQTTERFQARFGDRVAVLHSHLSPGERHDEWYRIRDGGADIVIGARSAVFAPLPALGLIVVDEEHETSYKQEESLRYHARDVAVMRGWIEGCSVVLGSATPSLESWTNVQCGKYTLSRLTRRIDHRQMPVMKVVDMRMEANEDGKVRVLSRYLMEAIGRRLDRAEQIILFLNRRGFSSSLVCTHCGHVAECKECSVSCTYHRSDGTLKCHLCGRVEAVPERCPSCKDPSFRFAGIGTQRVERILGTCFPKARVQRMDRDTMTAKDAYEKALGDFRHGNSDILIGTQMIAKGLHFPNVTLVGVIYADLSLHMPDFRAGERTFQLLAQVAGRAGRGDVHGEVIVQTYTPFHPAVQAARRLDYDGFCDQEIEFRKELNYPPISHLVNVTFRGKSENEVSYCAGVAATRLAKRLGEDAMVAEAIPAPIARIRGQYRYQVMLRGASCKAMNQATREVVAAMKLPDSVHCVVDVDALSLL